MLIFFYYHFNFIHNLDSFWQDSSMINFNFQALTNKNNDKIPHSISVMINHSRFLPLKYKISLFERNARDLYYALSV